MGMETLPPPHSRPPQLRFGSGRGCRQGTGDKLSFEGAEAGKGPGRRKRTRLSGRGLLMTRSEG